MQTKKNAFSPSHLALFFYARALVTLSQDQAPPSTTATPVSEIQ